MVFLVIMTFCYVYLGGTNGLMSQILPKFTEMIGESLKAEGIDIGKYTIYSVHLYTN